MTLGDELAHVLNLGGGDVPCIGYAPSTEKPNPEGRLWLIDLLNEYRRTVA